MKSEGIAVSDFKGLHDLHQQAKLDANKALPEAAKQFEAIFLQSMLKSMRGAQSFLAEDSPFQGKYQETFRDMLDAQYASKVSSGKGIGLADMLTQQLTQSSQAVARPLHPLNSVSDTTPSFISKAPRMPAALTMPEITARTEKKPDVHQSMDDFVKSVWPYAREAASLLGLDPKILVAQAALETGWGQFVAKDSQGSSNNLFNIKSSSQDKNASVEVNTKEYIADKMLSVKANFKKYATVEHSFNDYVSLIKGNDRYEAALANAHDPQRYIKALHDAGYATDPQYETKVLAIYHGNELQQVLERNGFTEMP